MGHMANRADQTGFLRDGSPTFISGMDASREPSDISRTSYAFGINVTCRGGPAKTRPGWFKHDLTFTGGLGLQLPLTFGPNPVETGFVSGYFQEGRFYNGNGIPSLLSSHSGRQFRIDLETFSVTEITPTKAFSTFTTAGFTIPAVNGTVQMIVSDASRMSLLFPLITVSGHTLSLTQIQSSTTVLLTNKDAASVGVVIGTPVTVSFIGYDPNDPTQQLNWSTQAEQFWILQDNQSLPIIFDGAKAFRSNPALYQVPVGNVMAEVNGRLAVALPDRQSYRVGDIVFGSSGTPLYGGRDAVLYFTENNYLNEGGDFVARVYGAPSDSGSILSMKAGAQTDSALGQGPLIIGTPNVVFTSQLPFDRTIWKSLSNILQTSNPIIGPVSQNAVVNVNTDQWYRSLDGIRSYITAQRQFNGSWGNTAQSNELDDLLDFDSQMWLEHASAVLFQNRLLTTVSPQQSPNGIYHRGLVSLDFDLTTTLSQRAGPAWEGVWTGLRILKIVTGKVNNVDRCFMYALNESSQIELWELSQEDKFDQKSNQVRIQSELQLPSYNCGDSDRFKKIETGRLLVTAISGKVDYTVTYRSDEWPCWVLWVAGEECSKNADCGPFSCSGPQQYADEPRRPIRLPTPSDDENCISNNIAKVGYEHQIRLNVTGYFELKSFRLYTKDTDELLGVDRQDGSN